MCGKHEKNASLSGSTALEELITKRNHTWENHSLQATQDSQFFGEGKPEASGREAKKQKLQSNGLVTSSCQWPTSGVPDCLAKDQADVI